MQGITPVSGTPLGTSRLLNINAGKLFDFIREKLAIPYTEIFEQWTVPEQIEDLKSQDVLRLTGDSDLLTRLHKVIVDNWYLDNLVFMPPHTEEIANTLKAEKMMELKQRPELLAKALETTFKNFKPHVSVVITGEQVNLDADLASMLGFVQLEQDPIRISAILELMARKKGYDFGSLPKSSPQQMTPPVRPEPVGAGTTA